MKKMNIFLLNHKRISAWILSFDVFVLLSRIAGLGLVFLLGMFQKHANMHKIYGIVFCFLVMGACEILNNMCFADFSDGKISYFFPNFKTMPKFYRTWIRKKFSSECPLPKGDNIRFIDLCLLVITGGIMLLFQNWSAFWITCLLYTLLFELFNIACDEL